MCQAFSCIVTKSGKVYWQTGVDSHDVLIEKFNLRHLDKSTDPQDLRFARCEITPDEGYLYPEKHWTFQIDEKIKPIWWHKNLEKKCYKELENWKESIYPFINLEEARKPINPLTRIRKPTQEDIDNLKEWASVWASVGASVWDSVGDSVGASVGAYIGSLFNGIEKWKYIEHEKGEYPFRPAVDLWKRGFVPSFDGATWRLHGHNGIIVWEDKDHVIQNSKSGEYNVI